MTEFNVGDKVRYNSRGQYPSLDGLEGTVLASGGGTTKFTVTEGNDRYTKGDRISVTTKRCTLIEPAQKPFTFEDIQKGDTIRRTRIYAAGSKEVREGVANYKGAYYWADGITKGFILAYGGENESDDVTYELLERPEPPHWTESKPVGSIGIGGKAYMKTVTKVADDKWHVLYHDGTQNYFAPSNGVAGHLLDGVDHFNWVA